MKRRLLIYFNFFRIINISRILFVGLIKKTLRKFESLALRNEIVVTDDRNCILPVGCTKAQSNTEVGANFILVRHSNF